MLSDTPTTKLQLSNIQAQCMALAAIIQSAELVRQLSRAGNANDFQVRPLLHSLFVFDAQESIDIYQDLRLLEQGFNRLYNFLSGNLNAVDKNILEYAITLQHLADSLLKRADFLKIIEQRLKHMQYPSDNAWLDLPHAIDAVYQDTISKLGRRVQISGEAAHLQNPLTASRIRTLLLAAIRAGVLWRQLGGTKWKLFLHRNNYKKTISELIPINT